MRTQTSRNKWHCYSIYILWRRLCKLIVYSLVTAVVARGMMSQSTDEAKKGPENFLPRCWPQRTKISAALQNNTIKIIYSLYQKISAYYDAWFQIWGDQNCSSSKLWWEITRPAGRSCFALPRLENKSSQGLGSFFKLTGETSWKLV